MSILFRQPLFIKKINTHFIVYLPLPRVGVLLDSFAFPLFDVFVEEREVETLLCLVGVLWLLLRVVVCLVFVVLELFTVLLGVIALLLVLELFTVRFGVVVLFVVLLGV